jgi:hypothetical protein
LRTRVDPGKITDDPQGATGALEKATMSRRSRYLLLVIVLVLSLGHGPLFAADEAEPDPEPTSVVNDVLRMLEGGVSSRAIVDWLNRKQEALPPLTPDEMISLSEAGASDAVIGTLTLMSERSDAEPAAPVPVLAPVAATPQAPPPTAQPTPQATDHDGKAGVTFSLKYKRPEDTGDAFDMQWKLFVYVDGKPVTYSRSQSSFVDQTIESFRWLSPGKHVLHLLHESHVKKGKRGVIHESEVCPDPIFFEVTPGDGWHVDMTYIQKTFSKGEQGPLTWTLKKGGEPRDGRKLASKDISQWPQLCEDMQANVPEGKKPPSWVKQKLKDCVKWSSLSEGFEPWPERAEIIAELERYDFKPPRD